ncbi:MAG: tetratricopeptide repeat protein, partial [Treponemataceae bacterium]
LTGNILAAVKSGRNPELAANIQTAIAFHEGLRAYGISYVLSPNRPFAKNVVDPEIVDTLKFPRQVLTFRAGDCADLSVLYASCFEAAGIETAFVTVPGHIFMAIDSGMTLAEAKAHAVDERELIVQGDKVWLPIETTMRDSGFLDIWRKAASEWRDASERKLAALYPLHEAWKTYAPVGLPADGSRVIPPTSDKIVKIFNVELGKAVASELNARLSALGPVATKGAQVAKSLNDRGVLYGRFGRYTEAMRDFQAAAKAGSDSALVNLGNVSMLKADPAGALEYYQAAARRLPDNSRLLVNLAKSAAALGKIDLATQALAGVRKLDPKAADQYSALADAGTAKTRAAAIDDGALAWF